MPKPRNRSSADRSHCHLWPDYTRHSLLFENLPAALPQLVRLKWEHLFPRVSVHWFYHHDEHGPAAGLIRFKPGGRVPLHEHQGFEHIFVLHGSQTDENGILKAGGFMIHAPGTCHSIISQEGCLVLAVYERRARFLRSARRL